jgi:hypothetical protein
MPIMSIHVCDRCGVEQNVTYSAGGTYGLTMSHKEPIPDSVIFNTIVKNFYLCNECGGKVVDFIKHSSK